ncbi:MAG: hypothetical protein DMC60_01555 [Verrucomicrobia bacterium]|nr:MAG: hypothetical protein DMC60_01555 [Verrucomicrobiota bacterium]
MHQLPVPKEAKQEHETEGCNKCDEESFPIHNVFLLRFLLNPSRPKAFIPKRGGDVDSNFYRQETCAFGRF